MQGGLPDGCFFSPQLRDLEFAPVDLHAAECLGRFLAGLVAVHRDESWIHQAGFVKKWNRPLIENEEIVELPVHQRTISGNTPSPREEFVCYTALGALDGIR